MSNDNRGVYILIVIAILAVVFLSLAFYFNHVRNVANRDINDGDAGMIIGFQ